MGRGGQRASEFGYLGRIPDFTRDVALNYVKRGYHLLCRHAITLFLLPVGGTILLELGNMAKTGELKEMWDMAAKTNLQFNMGNWYISDQVACKRAENIKKYVCHLAKGYMKESTKGIALYLQITFMGCCVLLTIVALTYIFARSKPVYLLDYHCYKPPDRYLHHGSDTSATCRLKMPHQMFLQLSKDCGAFTEKSMEFQTKIIERSGLGDETYLPDAMHTVPPAPSMKAAREEAEMVLYECVKEALSRSRLKPRQVDILIVNCSLFNPTPSLSAMIVNHFRMKSNVVSYNLSGMGCSAGVISIQLAKELLQVYPTSRALVVSTENITQNWYFGNNKAMLIPNCLFRVGGAALVLTNRRSDRRKAKYELAHVVRTHMGASDASYSCVYQQEDDDGATGVYLSKDLMAIAGHALKANITTLAPLVLPVSEQLLFFINLVARKVLKRKIKAYIPDFKLAFEHVCIHTGGRGVVEEIEKQLSMTPKLMQPSKDTLYRYGNTSSSSIWYVLANIETKSGVRQGDRVWQIAFGSGFKCNSAIWRALRNVNTQHSVWT